ncbi:hypothetical protein RMCBS344292_02965 [Rhizopus microsporus]|nr:hypothetical protein RMCBS344292_02965 [Rhizopus microsporus]
MNQNTERNKSTSPSIQQPSPLSTESSSARQRAPSYPNGITFSPTLTESQHKEKISSQCLGKTTKGRSELKVSGTSPCVAFITTSEKTK